jgi:cytochrome c peroxidase
VRLMAEHQNGRKITKAEIESIVTWLKALTGPIPQEYIKEPALPKSTPSTPKPDPA